MHHHHLCRLCTVPPPHTQTTNPPPIPFPFRDLTILNTNTHILALLTHGNTNIARTLTRHRGTRFYTHFWEKSLRGLPVCPCVCVCDRRRTRMVDEARGWTCGRRQGNGEKGSLRRATKCEKVGFLYPPRCHQPYSFLPFALFLLFHFSHPRRLVLRGGPRAMNEIRKNGSNESYLRFCTTSATTTTGIFLLGFPHTHAHTHTYTAGRFSILLMLMCLLLLLLLLYFIRTQRRC